METAARREPHRRRRPDARLSVGGIRRDASTRSLRGVRRGRVGSRGRAHGARARAQRFVDDAVDRTGRALLGGAAAARVAAAVFTAAARPERDAPPHPHARHHPGTHARPPPAALSRRHRPRVGGRDAGRSAATICAACRRHPAHAAAGHESRRHRQGQSAVDARVRDAPRHRRARRGCARGDRGQRQSDAVARHDRSRRRCAGARAGAAPADGPRDLSFIVTAEKDGDVAFVGSDWSGTNPSDSGHRSRPRRCRRPCCAAACSPTAASTGSDEEVHIKAVVRDDTPNGMRLVPEGSALDVVVRDGRVSRGRSADGDRQPLEQRRVDVARAGRRRARPTTDRRSPRAGRPALTATHRTSAAHFLVAAYRRPDFRVDATLTGRPGGNLGSTLRGTVEAKYLFGGALGTRPVRWGFWRTLVQDAAGGDSRTVSRRRGTPSATCPRSTSGRREEAQTAGEDRDARRRRPLDRRVANLAEGDAAYSYTFEGDVEDVVGPAHRQSRRARRASGVALRRDVAAADVRGHEERRRRRRRRRRSGRAEPVAGVPVTVSLVREEWVRYDVRKPRDRLIGNGGRSRGGVDGADGCRRDAAADSAARGRQLHPARDRARRDRPADAHRHHFYALGPGLSSWRSEGNRIDLTPERKTWKPGETARILIQSPWERRRRC